MSQPQPPPIRVARDPLVAVTCIIVMIAGAGHAYETVRQRLAATAASGAAAVTRDSEVGKLEEHAYTNALAAHITLTNFNAYEAGACLRGVVKLKGGAGRAQSAPVCSGAMKPRTTVTLEAPYEAGAVEDLCAGDPDRFGNRHIDWSRCSFRTELASAAAP